MPNRVIRDSILTSRQVGQLDWFQQALLVRLILSCDELDHETWQPIRTPDRLFDLGDTGEHNIVATIHKATVTGGVSVQTEADAEVVNTFCGFYQG